jgi:hypothetical protein
LAFDGSRIRNLGRRPQAAKAYSEAIRQYDRALGLSEKVYGPDHPMVIALHKILDQIKRKL